MTVLHLLSFFQEEYTFDKLVQLRIPHCLDDQDLLPYIRVQYGDTARGVPFQDVPLQAKVYLTTKCFSLI